MSFPLESIQVAAPCKTTWESMQGDDRVRFCALCKLNVFNLSGMSRAEAETLVRGAEGRLCIRMYRRADGTVLTTDCPVGLAARVKRKARLVVAGLAAMLLGGIGATVALKGARNTPFGAVARWLGIEPEPEPKNIVVGEWCPPTPPAPAPTQGKN
jgi:hypothetical protein